ncbi:MAG: SCO family protein [Pseudomonadota bacterium]
MKTRLVHTSIKLLLAAALAWSGTALAQLAPALPGNSVYQLKTELTDQDGHVFHLQDRRGKPVLISMFYNSCEFVCPMLIDTMRITEQALGPDERSRITMLLVTFDPARDTVGALKSVATKRELEVPHWTLARPDAAGARKIAATLGIQYRLLGNGEFNHTTVVVLLDAEGRILGQTRKLGAADLAFMKLVRQALQDADVKKS